VFSTSYRDSAPWAAVETAGAFFIPHDDQSRKIPRSRPSKANARVIFALWLVHFTGDLYASFVSPLLPVFADVFALSMNPGGLLAGVNRFLMFIVQPIAGYLADH